MARIPAPPQAVDTMSAAQLDRRQRVLDAVVDLVASGRVEDWGMKDVAERSGVALGTIYRYFSSKDHVAAAALLEWARADRQHRTHEQQALSIRAENDRQQALAFYRYGITS